MKKLLLVSIMLLAFLSSCNDDCLQDAYVQEVGSFLKSTDKVLVCHNGNTLEIDEKSLQEHLDHGDTEGECQALSDHSLVFGDGEIVQISCSYSLPFTYTDQETHKTYVYTVPE